MGTIALIIVAVVLVGLGLTPLLGLAKGGRPAHFVKEEHATRIADLAAPLLLVADDSLTIQKVIELSLSKHDVRQVATTRPHDALAVLQVRPFALAIVAYSQRLGDKLLAVEIKRRYPKLPVILMPGSFESYEPKEARGVTFDAVIKKPFAAKQLVARIEKLAPDIRKGR